MRYRIAYQRCLWEARALTEVAAAGSLEAEISAEPDSVLRITGWALARGDGLEALEARSLSRTETAAIDQPSADVEAIAEGAPGAANCRFVVELPLASLAPGDLDWTLWAVDAEGVARHFGTLLLEPEDSNDRPVFVLGAARSGTTAVGDGLRTAIGLEGYGECHAMPLLVSLIESVHGYYDSPNPAAAASKEDVLLAHVSAEEWQSRLATSMRAVYGNLHRGPTFVDKTPGTAMIHSLHVIVSVWPQARVVFTRRRGLENVESRRRKFPEQAFIGHCHDWSAAMLTWRELKVLVPESQRIEIDQLELAIDPAGAAERLGQLLDLGAAQRTMLQEYFETEAPERTSSDWGPISLDELSWSDEEREQFLETCGPAMEAFGYSLDREYWKDGSAPLRPGAPAVASESPDGEPPNGDDTATG